MSVIRTCVLQGAHRGRLSGAATLVLYVVVAMMVGAVPLTYFALLGMPRTNQTQAVETVAGYLRPVTVGYSCCPACRV